MGKPIATTSCQLTLTPPSTAGTLTQVTITTPASTSVKAEGKPCYFGSLAITIAGYSGGAITDPATGNGGGTLSPTATKVSSNSMKAVLEGDSCSISVIGTSTDPSGAVKPATQSVTVKISSAGQTKVTAI